MAVRDWPQSSKRSYSMFNIEHSKSGVAEGVLMKERESSPHLLPAGYYWFFEPGKGAVIVEKCEGESFVRFTSGRWKSNIGDGERFYGPLPALSLEEICVSAESWHS
jgi:hypothetical protein